MIGDPIEGMLSEQEARVLGCLMEKQMTTPAYYPLTLKALTAACNQKSSRQPVMNLSEGEVGGLVNGLRAEGLVTARMDGRADRYEQHLSRKLRLSCKERAVICVLMLRGPLTLNEIRINTGRMVTFEASNELQELLQQLMERDEPFLMRIPRAAGQREDRYAHLLCGRSMVETTARERVDDLSSCEKMESDRIARLEEEVAALKKEVKELWELTGK